jgi:tetrahydromethanopterin S-methyltransferase subunit G
MAVMPREKWTDDRLDDLNTKVDGGFESVDKRFDKVDENFRELRGEIKSETSGLRGELKSETTQLRGDMKEMRGELNGRLDSLDKKFDRLTLGIVASAIGIIATRAL